MKKNTLVRIMFYCLFTIIMISCSKDGNEINNEASNTNGKSGSITKFAVVGNYLYALNNNKLEVYDIMDKSNPTKINSIVIGYTIETIFAYNQKLYVGAADGIFIVDISNPRIPELKGSASHQYGCDPVVTKGFIAYSTVSVERRCGSFVNNSALNILNVSDDSNPYIINSINLSEAKGLGYDGNTLFVCTGETGFIVYDISSPNEFNPVALDTISSINATDVIAENGILIVSSPDKYSFYDYTDLSNIHLLNSIIKN